MYTVYFDSGTTNTRIYILNESGSIVFMSRKEVGSKDSALANDRQLLARKLHSFYMEVLESLNLKDTDISSIWMSGMVTSKNGIKEIPYSSIPVNLGILAKNIFTYREPDFFKRDIRFIPGIKSIPENSDITVSTIDQVNNMRGEETEIMGITSKGIAVKGNCIIILPGSHTQIAILKNGSIVNIISTITGELFRAIKKETILSASLDSKNGILDNHMITLGYRNLEKYGFNRALYIVRSLMLFTDTSASQRSSYLEGVLNGGVLKAIQAVIGKETKVHIFISGAGTQYQIFSAIADEFFPEFTISEIKSDETEPFSVLGFKAIYKEYGILHPDNLRNSTNQ